MSKFKVGDRVRLTANSWAYKSSDWPQELTIKKITGKDVYFEDTTLHQFIDRNWFELITDKGDNTVKERRTFKQLKDSLLSLKGALYQEASDDGTREYVLISEEHDKQPEQPGELKIYNRSLVEEQPDWFVEVFKVHPEYMTKEELEKWEAFKKGKKAPAKKKPTKKKAANSPHSNAREQVIKLTKQNISAKEIARLLKMAPGSVYTYRSEARKAGEL